MKFEFELKCHTDYMEDDEVGEAWSEGGTYTCTTTDFKTFEIETNQGNTGVIGPGYAVEDIEEIFETKGVIDKLPSADWLSSIVKDDIFRAVWHEHVSEDIKAHCESEDIDITDEAVSEIADLYVYEGKYDCNLSYWDNLNNLINYSVD